jgi:5'-nucleotidase
MKIRKPHILITNDDGIESPGLKAAVEAVMKLGTVTVVAPRHQQTGTGRGLTGDKQGRLIAVDFKVNTTKIRAYHGDGSPALIVRHCLRTLFKDSTPDLLVSGINYGENLGFNITGSGTVGAALEAASFGIPSIAASLQTDVEHHHSYVKQDWSTAAYFLHKFSKLLMEKPSPPDVDLLKIDIPAEALPSTSWKITKLARSPYYFRDMGEAGPTSNFGDGKTVIKVDRDMLDPDTDIYAVAVNKVVSVTPLSLDLTSRINLADLQALYTP